MVWLPAREAIARRSTTGRDADAAADVPAPAWRSCSTPTPPTCSTRSTGGRDRRDRSRPPAEAVDGDEVLRCRSRSGCVRSARTSPRGSRMSLGRAARSASAAAACSRPTPNMMTLDGTNTWVLREPGGAPVGRGRPRAADEAHLDAVAAAAGDVAVVLLTHHHLDHSEAARQFAERVGCGVRALDPAYRLGDEGLGDGDVVEVDGLEVRVVGDARPHLRLAVVRAAAGARGADRRHRARPRHDGRGAPRRPARRLPRLAATGCTRSPRRRRSPPIWPGHGPVIDDALGALDYYLAHRRERLEQVEAALASSARAATADPDRGRAAPPGRRDGVRRRRPGALGRRRAVSVRAQLDYLQTRTR